ncbi:MAG: cell division protein FtsA [Candidatus Paceibacterota bacterium]
MADQIISGIDIGSSKVAAIIAKASEESSPRVLGFASVPSRGVKRGQIVDINHVTDSIEGAVEKAERMAGTKMQRAFVSVGGPHIESLNSQGVVAVSHPEVEILEEDVSRVVEAAKAISLSSTREVIEIIPREFIVDGQSGIHNPVGMSGVRLEVNTHIITASTTSMKNVDRCLSDLGISTEAYVFSGLASAQACLSDTEKELGVVLVDIGGGKIDICVYCEGALAHSVSIGVGARHVTNDIAVGLRVSLDSAEKIKLFLSDRERTKEHLTKKDEISIKGLGLEEEISNISYKTVVDGIVRPRLEEMFGEVIKVLEETEFITKVPSGVVVSGGGALTVRVKDAAKRVVGLPARVGTPQNITGLVDEVLYPQYATSVGLLLYATEYSSTREGMEFKDFDKIFRSISVKGSMKKVTDLFKSLIP